MKNYQKHEEAMNNLYEKVGTYFVNASTIQIPISSKAIIRNTPQKRLKVLHKNPQVARERLFMFLNIFASSHYIAAAGSLKWEALNIPQTELLAIFKSNDKVILAKEIMYDYNLLVRPIKESYQAGSFPKAYLLASDMLYKKFVVYHVIEKSNVETREELYKVQMSLISKNPIAMSVVNTSYRITLPTKDDLRAIGAEKVSRGYHNKGKVLCMKKDKSKNERRIRNARAKYEAEGLSKKDIEAKLPAYSYVEDNVELFLSLTAGGFMLPRIGGFKSGGRVTSSFTLMPKWTREAIKLNGHSLIGVDYSSFHPNIASGLWGSGEPIVHTTVADYLGIDKQVAKVEHLRFFNTYISTMQNMKVWRFYAEKQPDMINKIVEIKEESGHRRIATLMFRKEVEIMTEVLKELEKLGLASSVVYVYDEFMVDTTVTAKIVEDLMNKVALKHNVPAIAKMG